MATSRPNHWHGHPITRDLFAFPFPPQNRRYRISFEGHKQKQMKTKITINSNGSLKVEGDFEITDASGQVYGLQGRTVLSLCRCGRSANKPFCDGSHKGHFEHDAKAFDLPPKKS